MRLRSLFRKAKRVGKEEEAEAEAEAEAEWPEEFKCPISKTGMADPVIVCSGQSYERACILAWMRLGQRHCYVYGTDLVNTTVISNTALKSALQNWCLSTGKPLPVPPPQETAMNLATACVENGSNLIHSNRGATTDHGTVSSDGSSSFSDISDADSRPVNVKNQVCPAGMGSHSFSAVHANFSNLSLESSKPSPSSHSEPIKKSPCLISSDCLENPDQDSKLMSGFISGIKQSLAAEQEKTLVQLRSLTKTDPSARISLCNEKLLSALLPLLKSKYPRVQIEAVAAVVNLSLENENKVPVVRSGMVPYLIHVLKCGHPEAQAHSAGALFSLALNDDNKIAIGFLGAIPPLFQLLLKAEQEESAKHDAALALYHLTLVRSNQSKLIKAGGISILMDLVRDEQSSSLVPRVLRIVCNIAASPEGRIALLDANVVSTLVAVCSKNHNSESKCSLQIQEHVVSVLFLLSRKSSRFLCVAMQTDCLGLMAFIAENGSTKGKEMASSLVHMIKEASSGEKAQSDVSGTRYGWTETHE